MEECSGIDAALRRHWATLRLTPELKTGFEAWAAVARRRENQTILVLTLAVSLLFVALDAVAGIMYLGLALRLGLEFPTLLLGCALLNRELSPGAFAASAACPLVLIIGGSVALGTMVGPDYGPLYFTATAAAAFAASLVLRLHVRHAVMLCLSNLLLTAAVPLLVGTPSRELTATIVVLALLSCINLVTIALRERREQDLYLLGLRGEAQSRELQRLVTELSRLSSRDALTGAGNRRSFDLSFEAAWRAAVVEGASLALVIMDVDHFKLFNDAAGHSAGDDCLRAVAGAIAAGAGCSPGTVSRQGGEEFALIVSSLPGTIGGEPIAVAEKVRRAVEMLALPHPGLPPGRCVTISVGVASTRPGVESSAPEALIEVADAALYRAKRAGRNRIAGLDGRAAA